MKFGDLMGKPVIDSQAQILGKICEAEFDTITCKIINLYIDLEKTVIEKMGFKKPRLGSFRVSIPVEDINAISDVVSLKKNVIELKGEVIKI